MDTPLIPGQSVRIFNEMTADSAECHVTSLREKRERRFVGVTFTSPNTDFWHIVFPKSGTRQAVRSPQTGALVPPGFRQDDNSQFYLISRSPFSAAGNPVRRVNLIDHKIDNHSSCRHIV